jgi:hypothetical protein
MCESSIVQKHYKKNLEIWTASKMATTHARNLTFSIILTTTDLNDTHVTCRLFSYISVQ